MQPATSIARPEEDLLLGEVGVSPEAERAYLHLLERPGSALRDLAAALGFSVRKTAPVLEELETIGLVTRSPDEVSRYSPAPPETAVEVLVLKRLDALHRTRLAIPRLANVGRERSGSRPATEVVRIFTGREAAVQHFNQIHLSARHEVLVLGELALRLGTNALRRRVRRTQRRVLLLQLPQFAHQPIVLGVRFCRCVEDEVLVVGAIYLFAQPFGARGEVVVNVRQSRPSRSGRSGKT